MIERRDPRDTTRRRTAKTPPHGLTALLVFVVAAITLLVEARYSPFEIDESGYIATSRYFGYLVFQRDVTREEWGSITGPSPSHR